MKFFIAIANFFKSLFGGKKTMEDKQDTYPVVDPDYILEGSLANELVLIVQSCKLNELEEADVTNQIIECRKRGIHHFVFNTHGRGEPSEFDKDTGDRYFEVKWLSRAKVHSIRTQFGGFTAADMMKYGCSDTDLWYDNLKEKFV